MKRREAIKNTSIFLGAISFVGATSLMQSCKPDITDDWKPIFFDDNQASLVAEIAETILPKTATPGAKDAKVSRYLDEYAAKFLKPEEQLKYTNGLAVFESFAEKLGTKKFVDLSSESRGKVLQSMIDDPSKGENSPSSVFHQFRSMVNMAFFSSEVGATQVLDNDPIPGDYIGDLPLSETNGKVYS